MDHHGEVRQGSKRAPEGFDVQFRAQEEGRLLKELWARAWGDEYPFEVEPFSSCSWSVMGEIVSALRLRPDDRLVDLGCGTGGVGLWLARAFNASLVGVDFSSVAIERAISRTDHWLPPGKAEFCVGAFEDTGLPDGCADAVVSLDALHFSPDIDAALAELRRLLRTGGRAAFTARESIVNEESDGGIADWNAQLQRAGLEVEYRQERPEVPAQWRRLYRLIQAHQDELRTELGDQPTKNLLAEARTIGPKLDRLRWPLLVVSRPIRKSEGRS